MHTTYIGKLHTQRKMPFMYKKLQLKFALSLEKHTHICYSS